MTWTQITRKQYERNSLRYASDSSNNEWSVIEPFLQHHCSVGRPLMHTPRDIWDAVQYIVSTACQWRALPKDFPPYSTLQHHFYS